MRIALPLMVLQFFAPMAFTVVGHEGTNTNTAHYYAKHSSIFLAILLEEKEEKEHDESSSHANVVLILDLGTHSSNLTATHSKAINYAHGNVRYEIQPAVFTRHCAFLI